MSQIKSRTTYNPFTHPKFAKSSQNQRQSISISLEVMPPLNLEELRALHAAAQDEGPDQTMWKHALSTEIRRCTPKPAHMRRALEHPTHPTQHARIDPTSQNQELRSMLRPETLRRTFISIPALMKQIHEDISQHQHLNH
jgi:hypothetical protein